MFRKLIERKIWRLTVLLVFSMLCLSVLIAPFIVSIEIEKIEGGSGHQAVHKSHNPDLSAERIEKESTKRPVGNRQQFVAPKGDQADHAIHEPHDPEIRVRGFMTLEQVSDQYHIPVSSILASLKIRDQIQPTESLGRLRRKYAFQMTDVEKIILNYKKDQMI